MLRIQPISRSSPHKEVAGDRARASAAGTARGETQENSNHAGLSQTELHKSLGVEEDIPYTRISDYELGKE